MRNIKQGAAGSCGFDDWFGVYEANEAEASICFLNCADVIFKENNALQQIHF